MGAALQMPISFIMSLLENAGLTQICLNNTQTA